MSIRGTRLIRLALAVPLLLGSIVAVEAVASPAMAGCLEPNSYSISSSTGVHVPFGPYFKDGPGGSMTASVTVAGTIGATATVSAGATVSGIVAEARVEVSASITVSTTVTIGHTYTHAITAHK